MKKAIALLAVQAGVILAWAGYHGNVRAHAPTFRVPLNPYDPYDVLRGRYFVLNPQDGRIEAGSASARLSAGSLKSFLGDDRWFQGDALVGFCPDGEVHRVCALRRMGSGTTGEAEFWSRAAVYAGARNDAPFANVDLGLRRFFVPNRAQLPPGRTGWQLEVSYRPGQRLLPRRLWFEGRPLDLD